MFNNIGGKIKTVAKVLCWIGIVGSVIGGIAFMIAGGSVSQYGYYRSGATGGSFLVGLLIALVGALASWIGSFLLYGFGELIDVSKAIENKLAHMPANIPQPQPESKQSASSTPTVSGTWRCHKCGKRNPYGTTSCEECGTTDWTIGG